MSDFKQQLENIIQRSENITELFEYIFTSDSRDTYTFENNNIPTLVKRLLDKLDALVDNQKYQGVDKPSITNILVDGENKLVVEYSNNNSYTFGLIVGKDGNTIKDIIILNDNLVIEDSENGEQNLGTVVGENGYNIDNIELNTDTGAITVTSNGNTTQNIGNVDYSQDINSISSTKVVDDELIVTYLDDTEENKGSVKGFPGKDASYINNSQITSDSNELMLSMSDDTELNAGKVPVLRPVANNKDILSLEKSDNDIIFNNILNQSFTINNVDGNDAEDYIISAVFDSTNNELSFNTNSGDILPVGIVPVDNITTENANIVSIKIDERGRLLITIEITDRNNVTSILTLNGDTIIGKDGIGIDTINYESNKLSVTNTNGNTYEISNVGLPFVNSTNITPDDKLEFVYSDGSVISKELPIKDGKDGRIITSTNIDYNNLIINTTTDSITLENVYPQNATAVENEGQKDLLFTFQDGSTSILNDIFGINAPNTNSIINVDIKSNSIYIYDKNDNAKNLGKIINQNSISVVDGELISTDSNGNVHNTGNIRNYGEDNTTNAKNGLSITKTKFDGDDLILYTNNTFKDENGVENNKLIVEGIGGGDGKYFNSYKTQYGTNNLVAFINTEDTTYQFKATKPLDGQSSLVSTDMYINDNRNLYIPTIQSFSRKVGKKDWNDDITISSYEIQNNNEIIITLSNDTTKNIKLQPEIGQIILDEVYVEKNEIIASYHETSRFIVENVDGKNAVYVTDMYIDVNRTLTIMMSDGNQYSFSDIDGEDCVYITNIEISNDRNMITELSNGTVNNFGSVDGITIKEIIVNSDGSLEIKRNNDTNEKIENIVRKITKAEKNDNKLLLTVNQKEVELDNPNGVDGSYPLEANIENGILTFDMTVGENIQAGLLDRNYISNSYVQDNTLVIETSNGMSYSFENIRGDDGLGVSDAFIDIDGNLQIAMSDGSVIIANDVKGKNGFDISSTNINDESHLILNRSDDATLDAGLVDTDYGFAGYRSNNTYNIGRPVIYNGIPYASISNVGENNPPPSKEWTMIVTENYTLDTFPPFILSPLNISQTRNPTLDARRFKPLYSGDEFEYREFQISTDIDFNNIIEESIETTFSYNIQNSLSLNTPYFWRCRDKNKTTGNVSSWSDTGKFNIPKNIISTPSISSNQNVNDIDGVINATASIYNIQNSGEQHISTDWIIREMSTGNIVYDNYKDINNLTSITIPFGYLSENKQYQMSTRYNSRSFSSGWSNWLDFKTSEVFTFNYKPSIRYRGDDKNRTGPKPRFETYFENDIKLRKEFKNKLTATWEVARIDDGSIVWSIYEKFNAVDNVVVNKILDSNVEYKIRMKYSSELAIIPEDNWSQWLVFSPQWRLNVDSISLDDDITQLQTNKSITAIAEIDSYNVTIDIMEWKIYANDTLISSYNDKFKENAKFEFTIPHDYDSSDIKIQLRIYSFKNVYSNTQTLMAKTKENSLEIYYGNENSKLIKLDSIGNIIWEYTHENSVLNINKHPDPEFVYASSGNLPSTNGKNSTRNIHKINSTTGEFIYKYTSDQYYITGIDNDSNNLVFVTNGYDSGYKGTGFVYDNNDILKYSLPSGIYYFDVLIDSGYIYTATSNGITKYGNTSGDTIWNTSISEFLLSVNKDFENNIICLHMSRGNSSKIIKFNDENGSKIKETSIPTITTSLSYRNVAISGDKKTLYIAGNRGRFIVYDIENDVVKKELNISNGSTSGEYISIYKDILYIGSGKKIIAYDTSQDAIIWEKNTEYNITYLRTAIL